MEHTPILQQLLQSVSPEKKNKMHFLKHIWNVVHGIVDILFDEIHYEVESKSFISSFQIQGK